MSNELAGLSLLLVEDDPLLRKRLTARLEALGVDVTGADTLVKSRRFLQDLGFDLALIDVQLPDGESTDLLKEKAFPNSTGVIVMTAHGGTAEAVAAMRLGALDYLIKPFDPAELPLVLARARRTRQSTRLHEHRQESRASDQLVFGPSLATVKAQMEKIVAADLRMQSGLPPVLIQGETGTGKTSFARWLHEHGPRSTQEMVEINCSALPESLAESELFGHEKGAFTDAKSGRIGLFEAASGGTLFLDELPSLSLPLQAKVLTAIEDRSIRRVGGNRGLQIDVRIIAATNRDLKILIERGDFREDLFHRLDLYRVAIPPLRERGREILDLAEQLKNRLCRQHRLPRKSIGKEGQERLLAQPWPGNVRELAHELERAIVFEEGQELSFPQLALLTEHHTSQSEGVDWLNEEAVFEGFSLETAIDRLVDLAMRRSNNNVSAAARLLHMPRDFVRYRLKKRRE